MNVVINNLAYNIDKGFAIIVEPSEIEMKSVDEVYIPEKIVVEGKTYEVKEIGYCAFYCYINLKKVTISNTIKVISDSAFNGCVSLEEVDIPDSVVKIGNYAFLLCEKLKSINIPNGVIEIGYQAFGRCKSLIHITIPNTVKLLGSCLFHYCDELSSVDNGTYYAIYNHDLIYKNIQLVEGEWFEISGGLTYNNSFFVVKSPFDILEYSDITIDNGKLSNKVIYEVEVANYKTYNFDKSSLLHAKNIRLTKQVENFIDLLKN